MCLSGIFHGYIHLGFALEFNQPAIVAEALSMGCIHDSDSNRIVPIFTQSEQLAGGPRQPGEKTLRHIMEEMRGNETLRKSIDGPHLYDRSKNVADNAMQEMIKYAAQYSISGDQLEEKMDEMIDTCSKELMIGTADSQLAYLSIQCCSLPQNQQISILANRTKLIFISSTASTR